MPGLTEQEHEAALVDLMAVCMYLREVGGDLDHSALAASMRAGDGRLLAYAACLTSGLARLPAYRGTVLRGAGNADFSHELHPGKSLCDPAPVSALPLGPGGAAEGAAYAIWSFTGRSVRSLVGDNEIVFAPGTAFKVLDVRMDNGSPLMLLRQLPRNTAAFSAEMLEDADNTARARLEAALAARPIPGMRAWPARCAGSIEQH
ncbi:hypothetical protein [Streptomyces sp. NPDC002547]